MSFKITLPQVDRIIESCGNETVLDSALREGIAFPFSCRSGRCGACKARLSEGSVDLLPHTRIALSDEEKSLNIILGCRAQPKSDLIVRWLEEGDALPVKSLKLIVTELKRLTHDIKEVKLETSDSTIPLSDFYAGQFANLLFPDCEPRSYSMANRPKEKHFTFFVRRVTGGTASDYVDHHLKVGDEVLFQGPFGTSYLRTSHIGPILLVAGGSGLAPILSIIREARALNMMQPIHLFFGVRTDQDVFGIKELKEIKSKLSNFSFEIVVDQGSKNFLSGRVGDEVLSAFPIFKGDWQAYLAGPPPLIDFLLPHLEGRGIQKNQIFADPFTFQFGQYLPLIERQGEIA